MEVKGNQADWARWSNRGKLDWPMIGRDRALRALESYHHQQGLIGICLSGAPGIGKTRLARSFHGIVTSEDGKTNWLTGHPGMSRFPFGSLFHWLDERVDVDTETPSVVATTVRNQVLGNDSHTSVLVLDDADLMDEASISLLAQLAEEDRRLFLLVTCRDTSDLPRDLKRLVSQGRVVGLTLGPLGFDAVAELVAQVLDSPIEEYTLQRMFDLCKGNPLLLRELVLAGLESEALVLDGKLWRLKGSIVSHCIPDLVERRLDSLPPTVRDAIQVLAVADAVPFNLVEVEIGVASILWCK